MTPFDAYKTYLALKNHFTKESYDYHKYCKKTRASLDSFYKRKDRYFFEKTSRQRSDKEVESFFVANFASSDDPQSLWIGEIIRIGETKYSEWKKKIQSLSYVFKEDSEKIFSSYQLEELFDCSKGHPPLLKSFLSSKISLETMVIYDQIFHYVKDFDKKLKDPIWESVSIRIRKYNPFLNINVFEYKKMLRQIISENK
ncbi:hypothetical protein EBS02_02020 [bacterium]|nr:hypothetical protein [bacterium]